MRPVWESTCPGCGLRMPVNDAATYQGYYNASADCWQVYTEVLGTEFSNALLFRQVHQLTVDTYAAQHPGGTHPDKSIAVHLSGLHLALERGFPLIKIPPVLHRLAEQVESWPHFPPPTNLGKITVFDVALSDSFEEHIRTVKGWAGSVWQAWAPYHPDVTDLLSQHLALG